MKTALKKQINALPLKPGVYLFKNARREILYIGKAKSLKKRVKSHFSKPSDLFKEKMVGKIKDLDFIETKNESEALILEEQLIKKYRPKFNIDWKDDKSYFWVVATNENPPRIFVAHRQSSVGEKILYKIGPFVNGRELRSFLRQLRKIAPYRSCKTLPGKPCLQFDLGNCPGSGRCAPKFFTAPPFGRLREKLVLELLKIYQGRSGRIEVFDISNFQGKEAVGSMAVFKNNRAQKSEYRHFKIKTVFQSDDPAMQSEIIHRRLNHPEWPRPDLVLLDGGKSQLSGIRKTLLKEKIPFLGLAKKEEQLFSPFSRRSVKLSLLPRIVGDLFMRSRDEAHRFAINYHRKLRKKGYQMK